MVKRSLITVIGITAVLVGIWYFFPSAPQEQFGSASTIDSYSESNYTTATSIVSGIITSYGQSFTAVSTFVVLDSAKFYLYTQGTPSGTLVAKVYAHSRTFGTNGIPTGTALAVSDQVNVSGVPSGSGSIGLVTFSFSGANRITLTPGTKYFLTIEQDTGTSDLSNRVFVGMDDTSPSHSGNRADFTSPTWSSSSSYDFVFYVYGDTAAQSSTGGVKIQSATVKVNGGALNVN